MIDNNLLTIFLNFHEVLASFKNLKNEGKQISNRICDLLTERQILQKSSNRAHLSINNQSLYVFAVDQINNRIAQEIILFQDSYLQKLFLLRSSVEKSEQILQKIKMDQSWMNGPNPEFRYSLYELKLILMKIGQAQKEQVKTIIKKWQNIRNGLLDNGNVSEQVKILVLHISFETHIEDQLLKYWDEGITGLQSKRYK